MEGEDGPQRAAGEPSRGAPSRDDEEAPREPAAARAAGAAQPQRPGQRQEGHRCTDFPWCLVLLIVVGAQIYLGYFQDDGFRTRNRAVSVFDGDGEACGEGVNENRSLLFWCNPLRRRGQHLRDLPANVLHAALAHPICVHECPTSHETSHLCYDIYAIESNVSDQAGVDEDEPPSEHNSTESTTPATLGSGAPSPGGAKPRRMIRDYPTSHRRGFCFPRIPKVANWMMSNVEAQYEASNPGLDVDLLVDVASSSLRNGWPVIAGACALALLSSFLYLVFLDHCAGFLVKAASLAAVAAPVCGGIYFIHCAQSGTSSGLSSGLLGGAKDFSMGAGLLLLGIVLGVVLSMGWRSLGTAVAIVEAGCECVFDERTLLLEPFVSSCVRIAYLMALVPGLAVIGSMGTMETVNGDWPPERVMHYTPLQWVSIVFYGCVVLWSVEFVHSCSQYVIAWVAQAWYFTPYVGRIKRDAPGCALCKGFYNLFRYHLGTAALGSLVILFLRPCRVFLGACKGQASNDADKANPASNCLGACCIQCGEFMVGLNKNAYIDVAINSTCLLDAARTSHMMVSDYFQRVFVLNSVQFIFQIGGVGLSTAVGASASFFALSELDFDDPSSTHFVFEKSVVVYTTAAFSFYVGCAFMVLFDTVSDTMFYCYVLDELALDEEELDQGWLGCPDVSWLLGGEAPEDDEQSEPEGRPGRLVYAPSQLREFMAGNGVHEPADHPD